MSVISRRSFMVGASAAGLAFNQPAGTHSFSFANRVLQDQSGRPPERLITVFLRGGTDFLNLVVPGGGEDRGLYEQARPQLQIPATELLPLRDSIFGLHPSAAPLAELFDGGKLAVVLGAGLPADTRSHFDAQRFIEVGGVSNNAPRSGWLARHLASAPPSVDGDAPLLPALALGSNSPRSFATNNQVVALPNLNGFEFPPEFGRWRAAQRTTMRRLYSSGDSAVNAAGIQALNGSNIIELNSGGEYEPRSGVEYPSNQFGNGLAALARLIKLDLGLATATIDLGGWDTHANQGNGSGGFFSQLVATLAQGLRAFYADLDGPGDSNRINGTTVVVMSEFGRRLRENSGGTDHGHGGAMFVLGGSVNGGLHGSWPGLAKQNLYDQVDLSVTTDYRQVFSEILIRKFANPRLGIVFPDYVDYEPLGLVTGDDLDPDYTLADALDPTMIDDGDRDRGDDDVGDGQAASDPSNQNSAGDAPVGQATGPAGSPSRGQSGDTSAFVVGGGVVAAVALGALALRRRRPTNASRAELTDEDLRGPA